MNPPRAEPAPPPPAPPRVAPAAPARPRRSPAFGFFCAYAAFIVYATLLPFQFTTDADALRTKRQWINWDPRVLQTGEPTPITDVVINILFFVPLGFIGVHAQRRRPTAVLVARGALAGAALSLGVETLQFFTPSRNPATSDVLTNGGGAALGALLAVWARARLQTAVMRRATAWTLREPLLVILAGHTLLIVLAALVPFDFMITVSGLRRGLRVAQLDPFQGTAPDAIGDLPAALQYALFAGLLWFVATRIGRAGIVARALGCFAVATALAAGLEVVQLIMRSHVCSTRDVLAAAAGALAGMIVGAVRMRGGRTGWRWAFVAAVAIVGAHALVPFRFDFDPTAMRQRIGWTTLVPYSSYYYKANVAAVADLLDGLLAYVPVAFVWARLRAGTTSKRVSHFGVAAACAGIALVLEFLQLGLPRRYPEISDVLTAALGGLLGAAAWRWYIALRPAPPAASEPASS